MGKNGIQREFLRRSSHQELPKPISSGAGHHHAEKLQKQQRRAPLSPQQEQHGHQAGKRQEQQPEISGQNRLRPADAVAQGAHRRSRPEPAAVHWPDSPSPGAQGQAMREWDRSAEKRPRRKLPERGWTGRRNSAAACFLHGRFPSAGRHPKRIPPVWPALFPVSPGAVLFQNPGSCYLLSEWSGKARTAADRRPESIPRRGITSSWGSWTASKSTYPARRDRCCRWR